MEKGTYKTNDFVFKTPHANWLYNRLIQLADDFQATGNGLNIEEVEGLYAFSHIAQRYQDMVANAFEKAMSIELSIIETMTSIQRMYDEDSNDS